MNEVTHLPKIPHEFRLFNLEEIGSQSLPDSCIRILFVDEIQEKDKLPDELKSQGDTMSKRAIIPFFFRKLKVQTNFRASFRGIF